MNERERDKNAPWRLAILRHTEEVTGNAALTCRYFGITRQAFYLRRRRYEAGGVRGAAGPLQAAAVVPARDQYRDRREDHLPAAGLPLRSGQDRDVPEAVPRRVR